MLAPAPHRPTSLTEGSITPPVCPTAVALQIISMVAKLSGNQEGEGHSEDAMDGTAQGSYGEGIAAAGGGHSAALLRKQSSGRAGGEELLTSRLPSKGLSKSPSLGESSWREAYSVCCCKGQPNPSSPAPK